jgi:hypothetical protein
MTPTKNTIRQLLGTGWHVAQDAFEKLMGGRVERTTTPVGNLVPQFVGEMQDDTVAGALYEAIGVTNADWRRVARRIEHHDVVYDPASVAAATAVENATTMAVPGAAVGDGVIVQKPTGTAGVAVAGARVSAAGVVTVTFVNPTAGAVDPPSETYRVTLIKR